MGIIKAAHLIYDYIRDDDTGQETASRAIDYRSWIFRPVILSRDSRRHNGSGKSHWPSI